MNYENIRIPSERVTSGHAWTAEYKLKRLLFALRLYPDWTLANNFAGVGNHREFLRYWLGNDLASEIQIDVKKRRKEFNDSSDICTVIEHAFTKYNAGQDHLNPFLSDDEYIEQEVKVAQPLMSQEEMMNLIGIKLDWSYETIIDSVEALVEIERIRQNPVVVGTGRYWVVAYRQIPLKSILKPFVLLARVAEDNSIMTIQGLWPIEFMKKRIDRVVPIPYTAGIDDIRYIKIVTVPTKKGPHMFKYEKIETWNDKND